MLELPLAGDLLLLLFACVILADTAAYYVGKALGRHRMAPTLSPKKSWEGALGGLAGCLAAALLGTVWYYQRLPWGHAFALGVILYELASGAHPHPGDDFAGVLAKVMEEKPRRLGERDFEADLQKFQEREASLVRDEERLSQAAEAQAAERLEVERQLYQETLIPESRGDVLVRETAVASHVGAEQPQPLSRAIDEVAVADAHETGRRDIGVQMREVNDTNVGHGQCRHIKLKPARSPGCNLSITERDEHQNGCHCGKHY